MADQAEADRTPLDRHHVPAVARHRPLPGARRAAPSSRRGSSAATTFPPSATRRASGTSARSSGCGSGCGSSPAARSTCRTSAATSSTRSPTCRSSSCARPEHEIKAYYNACLHRGRQLKDYDGRCTEFRCPFHGFTWALDGALARSPRRWDFPHVDDAEFALPEAKVGTWGGFVFINPDPDAEPLEDFLGDLPEHFDALEPRGPLRPGPRAEGHPRQLEDRAGGVLRVVPRGRPRTPDGALPRRRQQPGRHLGQLRQGDHARRHRRARC